MECGKKVNCKLYIDKKYYGKLNATGKEIFLYDKNNDLYYSYFPAEACNEELLYSCITAYCEISVISLNNAYGITDQVDLDCDIFRLGQSKQHFTLLINITYPEKKETLHDMMTFEITEQTANNFNFKLLGDQTLFSLDQFTHTF